MKWRGAKVDNRGTFYATVPGGFMSTTFWIIVVAFVVIDIAVIVFVMRRFMSAFSLFKGLEPARRNQLMHDGHRMVGEFLRTNYSGDPGQLPTALGRLRPQFRDLIRSYGVEADPVSLDLLIETSAVGHGIASRAQVREALQHAA